MRKLSALAALTPALRGDAFSWNGASAPTRHSILLPLSSPGEAARPPQAVDVPPGAGGSSKFQPLSPLAFAIMEQMHGGRPSDDVEFAEAPDDRWGFHLSHSCSVSPTRTNDPQFYCALCDDVVCLCRGDHRLACSQ